MPAKKGHQKIDEKFGASLAAVRWGGGCFRLVLALPVNVDWL